MELIGPYQGSGLEKPIFLVRRGDGRVIQMSAVVFAVVQAIDGERDTSEIARDAGARLERELSADDVAYLVEAKLRPARLVAVPGHPGHAAPPAPTEPVILGLRYRTRVIPERIVGMATRLTSWLFVPPIVVAVLGLTALFDRWLFFDHGLAQATEKLFLHPSLAVTILLLTVASTAFHELGHATACRYGGARPGAIGVGVYVAWPVFFSDVTDTYRLGRGGRLRTDLGGVYFNVVSALFMAGAYFETGFEPLLIAIALVQLDALHQFFPFFRLDGYYVASDLIGVPDLFQRMRPMLLSFIPGRPLHPQVRALKPWARYALATWVYLTFVVIAYLYYLLIQALPHVLATAWQSFMLHLAEIGYYWHRGPLDYVALAVFDELMLLFPLIVLAVTLVVIGRRLMGLWRRLGDMRPTKRVALALAAAVVLVVPLPAVTSPADYQAIKPPDRGTLTAPGVGGRPGPPSLALPRPGSVSPSAASDASPAVSPGSTPAATPSSPPPSPSQPATSPSPSPSSSPSSSPAASPSPTDQPSPTPSPT